MVTEPFGIQMPASTLKLSAGNLGNSIAAGAPVDTYQPQEVTYEPENNEKYMDHVESDELKYIFYLTLAFGFIEIIMIYGKSDFLNVNHHLNIVNCAHMLVVNILNEFLR